MEHNIGNLKKELISLKKRNRSFQLFILVLIAFSIVMGLIDRSRSPFGIITATKIVIRDPHGRDRIILPPAISGSDFKIRNDILPGSGRDLSTMLNPDAPGRGRLPVSINSSAVSTIRHFNYKNNSDRLLLNSK